MAFLSLHAHFRRDYGWSRFGQFILFLIALLLLGATDSPRPTPFLHGSNQWLFLAAIPGSESQYMRLEVGAIPEYQIKSVFMFNFAQFVEWPAETFTEAASPFNIGIWGEDPFGPYLNETLRGERIKNRAFEVKECRRREDILACQMLYVSQSERGRYRQLLASIKGRKILTVSDVPGFARNGGMIEFLRIENKIRLRINTDATQAAGLIVSSKMLSLAEIVTSTEN